MKFKVGDRVVYADVETSNKWHDMNIGWGNASVKVGTVVGAELGIFKVKFDDYEYRRAKDCHSYVEKSLELEHVYNSPLCKALA